MIIGMIEGGEIRIYESIDDVMQEWGKYPTDLASEAIILYDEDGVWLKPVFKYVPRCGFGWYMKSSPIVLKKDYQDSFWHFIKFRLTSVSLERASKEEQNYPEPLNYLLKYEATSLSKNKFVKTLEGLKGLYPYDD